MELGGELLEAGGELVAGVEDDGVGAGVVVDLFVAHGGSWGWWIVEWVV